MIAIALCQGIRTTRDLSWPYDTDHFRDLAYAEAVLHGRWQADALYAGESLWYNPLVPWVVAGMSGASGIPPRVLYARAGAYLNVGGALAFFVMTGVLFDWWVAAAALFAFLFLHPGNERPFAYATYSPWLYASGFAQGLFYAGVLIARSIRRSGRALTHAAAGLWLGLTFLAHTAPALLLGGLLVVGAVWPRGEGPSDATRRWVLSIRNLALILLAAGIVSLPLLWSVVGRYHLRVLNHAPAEWTYELLEPAQFLAFVRSSLSIGAACATVGLVWLLAHRRTRQYEPVVMIWAVINAALIVYGYAARLALPLGVHGAVVPDFHFLFYWRALAAVWAGVGIVAIVRACTARARPAAGPVALTVALLAGVLAAWPAYSRRFDFTVARELAQSRGRDVARVRMFDWIQLRTDAAAVFLARDDDAQFVIGPAGRHVVAVDASQSNPYVDWAARAAARDDMYAALADSDLPRFCAGALHYRVTHVVLSEGEERTVALHDQRVLVPALRSGGIRIWEVAGCAGR